jgi:type II secretory pathway component PulK
MRHHRNHRPGVILIALMVFLAIASTIIMAWFKLAAVERHQVRVQQERLQALWLAESGLERAVSRLANDPKYSGETWKIAATELGGRDAAEVLIRIESINGQANQRKVFVQADYPVNPERRNRRSKAIKVTLSAQGGSS